MNAPIFSVHNLSHTYTNKHSGGSKALDSVSFDVSAGTMTALVGPNGSGKSTLFKLITRVLGIQEGSITGIAVRRKGWSGTAREMGVLFQSPSLDPELTVFENLYHYALLYGISLNKKEVPLEMLSTLGIHAMLGTKVSTLSGGFQRRVELAKVLITQPRFLVLDEPFAGLDRQAQQSFFQLLLSLKRNHDLSVLLITHELEFAQQCDEVILINHGHIVMQDTPTKLLAAFADAILEIRTCHQDEMAEQIHAVFGANIHTRADGAMLVFHDDISSVLRFTESRMKEIESVLVRKPTLEDYFLLTTGNSFQIATEATTTA